MARNNTVRTDVISKLGILERQEAAWKDPDYNYVWEGKKQRKNASTLAQNQEKRNKRTGPMCVRLSCGDFSDDLLDSCLT